MPYVQWTLRTTHGVEAWLYLETTAKVQRVLYWSGELSYQGAGYEVVRRSAQRVRLDDGHSAPISVAVVRHGGDRQVIAYAVVSPDGIVARGTDDLVHATWDTLRGARGPYDLVRVAASAARGEASARAAAFHLLGAVLPRLTSVCRG